MKIINKVVAAVFLGLAGTALCDACTVDVSPVNFGNYQPIDPTPLNSTGVVTIGCSVGVNYNIILLPGNSPTGYFPRQMLSTSATSSLAYNLFIDIPHSMIWGDGWAGTYTRFGSGAGSWVIYGQIPPNQYAVKDGFYTDIVGVMVEY